MNDTNTKNTQKSNSVSLSGKNIKPLKKEKNQINEQTEKIKEKLDQSFLDNLEKCFQLFLKKLQDIEFNSKMNDLEKREFIEIFKGEKENSDKIIEIIKKVL